MGCSISKKSSPTIESSVNQQPEAQPSKNTTKQVVLPIEVPVSIPSLPILPDDILKLIFEQMTTDDRNPVGLVSKRFRNVDLSLGKRSFKEIEVVLVKNDGTIDIHLSTSVRFCFNANGEENKEQAYLRRFFNNATAESVDIIVSASHGANSAHVVASLFESLTYQRQRIVFEVTGDLTDFAISLFNGLNVGERNIEVVELKWSCTINQNITRLRQALKRFEKVKNLEIEYFIVRGDNLSESEEEYEIIVKKENCLLDGPTLIHLVNFSDVVSFIFVDCKACEIFDAFEIVCESSIDNKCVLMRVASSVAAEVLTLARARDEFEVNYDADEEESGYIIDASDRRSVMLVWDGSSPAVSWIAMCKQDKDGNPCI